MDFRDCRIGGIEQTGWLRPRIHFSGGTINTAKAHT
jgi:hypothetical protein